MHERGQALAPGRRVYKTPSGSKNEMAEIRGVWTRARAGGWVVLFLDPKNFLKIFSLKISQIIKHCYGHGCLNRCQTDYQIQEQELSLSRSLRGARPQYHIGKQSAQPEAEGFGVRGLRVLQILQAQLFDASLLHRIGLAYLRRKLFSLPVSSSFLSVQMYVQTVHLRTRN